MKKEKKKAHHNRLLKDMINNITEDKDTTQIN